MRILALDIGMRRTGVAFVDEDIGVPLPLDTLRHTSRSSQIRAIEELIRERRAERIIIGLPLLPSGEEGAQAKFVLSIVASLEKAGVEITLLDERYTNKRGNTGDPDAFAAWNLLQTAISMKKEKC